MPQDAVPAARRVRHSTLIDFIVSAYRAVGIDESAARKAAALMA